ncbi:ATP-binding cassette, subfamily C, LapB [Desulfomicrobium apsheronum]|uniref:ATP-binding cassette, subfamily C, LapB n=1 Tax=Desulfomicrobium apsheronum TaxID=52560 RepID=A0A1I3XYD3_9BACT|nr:type I secretion system permease/ATPase [Desulfomicrobium apsheronum]SFK24523.1 ATP-binding cassette, subfamily C, LapB [Desulfomicrobium apsheronum]
MSQEPQTASEETIQSGTVGRKESPGIADALTGCLLFVARHHGRILSPASLLSGLPLDAQGCLTPGMIEAAARNAGLSTRIVRSPLKKIARFALPAVLFLKDDEVCVLREVDGENYTVSHPDLEDGVKVMTRQELEKLHTGHVLYLMPTRKEASPQGAASKPKGHWLQSALLRNWRAYSQVIIAATILNMLALAMPLFVMNVYDRVVPNSALETLWVLAMGMGVVFVFDFAIKGLRAFFIDSTGKKIDVELEGRLFDQLLDMHLKDKPASVGSFANLLRELEVLRDFFTSATLVSFVDLPFIMLFIIMFWYIGGPIAFIFMAVLPITLLIGLIIHVPIKKSVETAMAMGNSKHAVLVETLSNIETIKGLGCEATMRGRWMHDTATSARHAIRSRSLSHLAMNLTGFVQQFAYVIIIIVGVYLIKDGKLTMGGLVACSILSGRVMGPFAQIAQLITRLHHTMSAYRELNRIMDLPVERTDTDSFLHRPRLDGSIEFRDVTFSYPGSKLPALKGLNLRIAAGERVGIVGRTGSGKSTLGKLIMSLYSPDQGSVLVDGADLRQVDPTDLRRWTGYMPQDVALFQGTVRQNISMAHPQASDQEILHAARISGTHDFMSTHPQGYALHVGERGSTLSGGQRQAISIARALLRDPRILVMDEPSSSMDSQSEALLLQRLKFVLDAKTLVLITHRPSLLELVDRLVVIDDGRVVADGPKEAIMRQLQSGGVPVNQTVQRQTGVRQ